MINDSYDVAVVGGGLCGFACAMKSASRGRKTLLLERRPALGWEITWAYQLNFGESDSAITRLVVDELSKAGGFSDGCADAPITEILLDRLADKTGVSVLLYSYPVRLIFEGDRAFGVVIGNKNGEQILKAKVMVDATEEALLWRQTGVKAVKSENPPASHVVFFNHAEEMNLPFNLGDGITIHPSVWKGEACVEFQLDEYDLLEPRRKMLDVLRRIRSEVPQLKDALVTHVGNEPFPTEPFIRFENSEIGHPEISNFFSAGIWSSDEENTPAGRLTLGEKVGEIASDCKGVDEFPPDMMTGSFIKHSEVMSDVLVVGGGTGGAIASIASGRQGAKTTLVEASPSLGGIGTGGAIHWYCAGTNGGIQDEVDERINELTPLFIGKWKSMGFHPEVKKLVLQQMAEDAGVKIILNVVFTGVLRESGETRSRVEKTSDESALTISESKERMNKLTGIITVGSEGVAVYRAKVFIDSTGDGDVAAMSGAPFVIGRERDNLPHAYSQSIGMLDSDGSLTFTNFDAGYVDPTDVDDLTRGRRLGINLYWQDRFTESTRPLYIAPIIGLRQSRQIIGEYQLTLADQIAGRRFQDGISFATTFYDNHGYDYENESDEAALWIWALGNFSRRIGCEIPYRCLIPKNVDNLILACRAISLTFDAHAGLRMQKDIQRIGEVAGVASAMSAKDNLSPRQIDISQLQSILKESGILDEKYRPQPAVPESKTKELPAPSEPDPEKIESLVWISTYRGADTALALKSLLKSDDPNIRFSASAALARHGVDEGINELLKFVKNRTAENTKGNKAVPIWQASITFLGMSQDRRAIPAILEVLKDKDASLDAIIGSVRALERIGDESVIPALKELLLRDDLPVKRSLQMSMGALKHLKPSFEEARWQIDLAVAEALSNLGASGDEVRKIAEPYHSDPRAYVWRYAKKLL